MLLYYIYSDLMEHLSLNPDLMFHSNRIICELVGLFILTKITALFGDGKFGLHRNMTASQSYITSHIVTLTTSEKH